jgi:phage virion morphogenesis protein
MAGIKLTVEVDDAAIAVHAAIAQRIGKGRPLMQAIGQSLLSSSIRRFSTQSGPDGQPWPKLSAATLKKRGPSAKALLASGRLRQSLTYLASNSSVEVGTNLVYARIQQLGGTTNFAERTTTIYRNSNDLRAGRSRFVKRSKSDFATDHTVGAHSVTIPARPYLGVSAQDQRSIAALVPKFVMGR